VLIQSHDPRSKKAFASGLAVMERLMRRRYSASRFSKQRQDIIGRHPGTDSIEMFAADINGQSSFIETDTGIENRVRGSGVGGISLTHVGWAVTPSLNATFSPRCQRTPQQGVDLGDRHPGLEPLKGLLLEAARVLRRVAAAPPDADAESYDERREHSQ
jgi:hypothetical protein